MALAVVARLYGKEDPRARSPTPRSTNWHTDSTRDPFSRFLNKGNAEEILRRMGRA